VSISEFISRRIDSVLISLRRPILIVSSCSLFMRLLIVVRPRLKALPASAIEVVIGSIFISFVYPAVYRRVRWRVLFGANFGKTMKAYCGLSPKEAPLFGLAGPNVIQLDCR
jgi:hypothetical protein